MVSIVMAIVATCISNTAFAGEDKLQNAPLNNIPSKEKSRMSETELEARGKLLRHVIDAKYKELNEPGGAFSSPELMNMSIDIVDLFTPYIPNGMSFDDATVVLHAAGFLVTPSKLPETPDSLVGSFSYVRDMNWFITVGIVMVPDVPHGHKVAKSEATIWKQRH